MASKLPGRSGPLLRTDYASASGLQSTDQAASDLTNYLEPMAQLPVQAVYGPGVVRGYAVSLIAAAGAEAAQVQVAPGLAFDAQGQLIELVAGGVALIGVDANPTPVAVSSDGVRLVLRADADVLGLRARWQASTTAPQLQHAPQLALLSAADLAAGEDWLILARVGRDADGRPGLRADGRSTIRTQAREVILVASGRDAAGQIREVPTVSLRGKADTQALSVEGNLEVRGSASFGGPLRVQDRLLLAEIDDLKSRSAGWLVRLGTCEQKSETFATQLQQQDTRGVALAGRCDDLAKRGEELAKRGEELARRSEDLTASCADLLARSKAVAERTAALEARDISVQAAIDAQGSKTNTDLLTLRRQTTGLEARCVRSESRLDQVESRLTAVDQREAAWEGRASQTDGKVQRLAQAVGTAVEELKAGGGRLDARCGQIETRVTELTGRVGKLETGATDLAKAQETLGRGLATHEARFSQMEPRLAAQEGRTTFPQLRVGAGNSPSAGRMAPGSLVIGNTGSSFGGGRNWNGNTAGLLLETSANTEIAVFDSNQRLASLAYYEGDAANRITLGRDMGWGAISEVAIPSKLSVAGELSVGGTLNVNNCLQLNQGYTFRITGPDRTFVVQMVQHKWCFTEDGQIQFWEFQPDFKKYILRWKAGVGSGIFPNLGGIG